MMTQYATASAEGQERAPLRAWAVVAAAAIGYGTGGALMMNALGLFILPMRDALNWSISAVTIAPIVSLVWALASPVAGHVIDRVGSRTAAISGVLALAACLVAMTIVPATPAFLYGTAIVMGMACSFTAVPTYTRAVATWFHRNVGLAFGLTLSGSSLVAIAALPFTGLAIDRGGWRIGFLALALLIMVMGLGAVLSGFRERSLAISQADEAGGKPDPSTLAEALRDIRFWLFAGVFGLACIAVGGFVGHLQPILRLQGFGLPTAIGLGVLYSVAISVGRIGGGVLLDRLPPFVVAAAMLLLAAVGAAVLPGAGPNSLTLTGLLVLLLGLGHGAEADFLAFFGLRTFGLRVFSAVVGIYAMISSLAVSLGIFAFGAIADLTGGYAMASRLGAACFLAAAILIAVCGVSQRLEHGEVEP